ncbi:MAG: lipid A deacylase LpxR family protein [Undibacterium sp.]|nr:lipid A deacylase LpxR family protein [Undibacterium sp.]
MIKKIHLNRLFRLFRLWSIGALFLISSAIQAQDFLPNAAEFEQVKSKGQSVWILDIDNDSLLLKREDGFYTSGIHFISKTRLKTETSAITYAWQIGQDLYTASDIKLRPAQIGRYDHPYAGWLYVGASREQQMLDGSSLRLSLDVGCLGPCAGGEWTQSHLHRLLKQVQPQAWSTQLKQEWGAVLGVAWSPASSRLNTNVDVTPMLSARLGNIFTDSTASLTARIGQLNGLAEQAANLLYLKTELKLVAYNATLQGGYFNRQIVPIHPKQIVPEVELGYQYQQADWGVRLAIVRRGSEIKELSNSQGAQNFAKIQFVYAR